MRTKYHGKGVFAIALEATTPKEAKEEIEMLDTIQLTNGQIVRIVMVCEEIEEAIG